MTKSETLVEIAKKESREGKETKKCRPKSEKGVRGGRPPAVERRRNHRGGKRAFPLPVSPQYVVHLGMHEISPCQHVGLIGIDPPTQQLIHGQTDGGCRQVKTYTTVSSQREDGPLAHGQFLKIDRG